MMEIGWPIREADTELNTKELKFYIKGNGATTNTMAKEPITT